MLLDVLLDLLKANQLSNLKLLALYSPPTLDNELLQHIPETLDGLVIESSRAKINVFPKTPRLVVMKNCALNDNNSAFITDSVQEIKERQDKLLKEEIFRRFGACRRHSSEDEILEHYTEKEIMVIRMQMRLPGPQYIDFSWNQLGDRFLADFCKQFSGFQGIRCVNLERNAFGHFIRRLQLKAPEELS